MPPAPQRQKSAIFWIHGPHLRTMRMFLAMAALSFLMLWTLGAYWIWKLEEDGLASAERRLEMQAFHATADLRRLMVLSQSYVMTAEGWLADEDHRDPRQDREFAQLVSNFSALSDNLILLRLVDHWGYLWVIPGQYQQPPFWVGDRDYFRAQLEPVTRGFFVGRPILSRVTRQWVLPISLPVRENPFGFTTATVALPLAPLQAKLGQNSNGLGGQLTLHRADGLVLLSTVPGIPRAQPDPHFRAEEIHGAAALDDGLLRVRRQVPGFPLWVTYSQPAHTALAPWHQEIAALLASLVVVSFAMIIAAWHHLRSITHNLRLAEELQASEQLLLEAQYIGRMGHWSYDGASGQCSGSQVCRQILGDSLPCHQAWRWFARRLKRDARQRFFHMLHQLHRGSQEVAGDFPMTTPEGERWFHLLCRRHGPNCYFGILQDITETKRLQRELERLAATDPLTGLLNRRAFVLAAEQEIARALRYPQPLALIMYDLDHFKVVNDCYGHETGDRVLAATATCCQQSARQNDLLARIGGEEFVLLAVNTGLDEARAVAERMREQIAALELHYQQQRVPVTASFGIALLGPDGTTLGDLLRHADERLYGAKAAGRNRVWPMPEACDELAASPDAPGKTTV